MSVFSRRTRTVVVAAAVVAAAFGARTSSESLSLIDAVKAGDRDAIRSILKTHPDVNLREADGTTALHWAVRSDDLDTVRLLISAGATVNAVNRYGVSPLTLAAVNASRGAITELVKAGADVNTTTPGGETVLMTASRTGDPAVVKLLLDRRADVSAREHEFGETALMWAAAENHAEAIKLLAAHGADLDARANVLQFPNVKVDAATMVITAMPRGGLTPLMYAARQGSVDGARALAELGANLNATDPDGMSALVIAIINAHYDVAATLVDVGADPNVADVTGMAALYAAVDMHTLDPLVNRPAPTGNTSRAAVDLVGKLLQRGARANATLKTPILARQHNFGDAALGNGATALMRAAKNGDVAMMEVLLANGASASQSMPTRMTPLLFAVSPSRRKSSQDALAAARLCLDHGADVNAADATGNTPLHLAVTSSDDLVRLLAQRGANLNAKDQSGRTPLDVATGAGAGGGGGRGGRGSSPGVREYAAALLRELGARSNAPR
jgi:ankyrin repeat protein